MLAVSNSVACMRRVFLYLVMGLSVSFWAPARAAHDDMVLPTVDYTATAIHESGAVRTEETIHYADGKLRIDRGSGFSSTILDLRTQTQCLLMVNRTYLLMPMDQELYRRYIARTPATTGARKVGTERIEGLETTKYAFGEDGALDAAGSYWLTSAGVMVRRDYDDGVFGHNVHHREFAESHHVRAAADGTFCHSRRLPRREVGSFRALAAWRGAAVSFRPTGRR